MSTNATGQPEACKVCGYSRTHADDCPNHPDADTSQPETVPESPAPDQDDARQPSIEREVTIKHAGPDAPEAALGIRWHGPPAPIMGALARAQGEFSTDLPREGETEYDVEDKRGNWHTVEYNYVTLKTLVDELVPKLADQGIALMQPVSEGPGGGRVVRTILAHESGSMVETTLALPDRDKPQKLASAITYYRRYALAALLGVSAETDDDAQAASTSSDDASSSSTTSRSTGREGDGPVKQTATFTPSSTLTGAQIQRLEKGPWEQADEGHWEAELTPVQVNSWTDILESLGEISYNGGDA